MNLFGHLHEVREITKEWLIMYNEERPHESLAGLAAPAQFAKQRKTNIAGKGDYSTLNQF